MLLPVGCLLRRADAVEVIGSALVAAGAGLGHRRVAGLVERPAATVRGWLRRFDARAGPVREGFTTLAVAVGSVPVMPEPAGSPLGDAVAAILTAARAVWSRWPGLASTVSVWQVAAAITSGRLLAPTLGVEWTNTSRLW
jgi:hypothetical protein